MTLYVPRHFAEADRTAVRRLLDEHGFATLITAAGGEPMLSHVPILVEHGTDGPVAAIGHVAAANPHAALLGGSPALLVFQGPHGYVSPNWYTSPATSVPTWNYVAVHLHGDLERIDRLEGKRAIVDALSARHEAALANPWTSAKMDPAQLEKMLGAIVGFRMTVRRADAKFKLSQNRSAADRAGVLAALDARGNPADDALAAWMRQYSNR
jgi:transcriptional regulator